MNVWNRNEQISLSNPPGSGQSGAWPVLRARLDPPLGKAMLFTLFGCWEGGVSSPSLQLGSFPGCKTVCTVLKWLRKELRDRVKNPSAGFCAHGTTHGPQALLITWECRQRIHPKPPSLRRTDVSLSCKYVPKDGVTGLKDVVTGNLRLLQSPLIHLLKVNESVHLDYSMQSTGQELSMPHFQPSRRMLRSRIQASFFTFWKPEWSFYGSLWAHIGMRYGPSLHLAPSLLLRKADGLHPFGKKED